MTKLDLQKELLEKVKPGMKPSDLKKKPIPQPKVSDEGYESDRSDKSIPTTPPLPNQDLVNQINSLKNQHQVYQDFKEADLKIKEKYKQEIAEHKKTIAELKSQAKPTRAPQPQETKTFLCSSCQQTKPTLELSRVFGDFSFCLACSKKARQQAQQEKSEPQEFICHSCSQVKQELPNKMKLDST